jgi:glycosyltransferase involved in cell wall biosynthesis
LKPVIRAPQVRTVAMLGNHAPRQCGIATFTTHLADAISHDSPDVDCFVLAMNDVGSHHDYPARVRFEIAEADLASYRRAADFLNVNSVDVVSVQHEFGIFGGKGGSFALALLRELRMPIVTTLHTILDAPDPDQRAVLGEILRLSERAVVMSAKGRAILETVYGVAKDKIDLIPHGIPEVPLRSASKDRLGIADKPVIFTFGLLSPDKGIDHVIDALPAILARHPETIYLVVGATHPHVKAAHGEAYRLELEARARRLGVEGSVMFHDRFVSEAELGEFLSAADIYITPYLKETQITSGTLAYAVGAGKAVISTPYWYASELLADERGILVPFRDAPAIANAVIGLLDDETKRRGYSERAAAFARDMKWPVVARRYMTTFARARAQRAAALRSDFKARTLAIRPAELPEPSLVHLRAMTDDTGLLQHAAFDVPCYEHGYCVDDNARALRLVTLLDEAQSGEAATLRALSTRYLAFVNHAFDPARRRFRNFMSYDRKWLEAEGSEDSHGRALWALGTLVGHARSQGRKELADGLFHAALPATRTFTSPRAWAFTLLGIDEYLTAFQGDSEVETIRGELAWRLVALLPRSQTNAWPWFEESVTYENARLCQALLASSAPTRMGSEELRASGLRSLEWLASLQRSADGYFAPIGSNGFFRKGGVRAEFDQQPIEACAMVAACLEAARVTGHRGWREEARRAFAWFLGQNQKQLALYEPTTGACRDGLHADRVNENQGAESTLSYLMALAELRAFDRAQVTATATVVQPPPPLSRERLLAVQREGDVQ